MGSRGPAPKPAAQRRARNVVPGGGDVEVSAEAASAREIPPGVWHDNAVAWWDDAVGSPAVSKWVESDWSFVHRGLVLAHQWWTLVGAGEVDSALRVHRELMAVEKKLYLTPEDRARGHIEVKPAGAPVRGGPVSVATPVTSIAKWQGRVSG